MQVFFQAAMIIFWQTIRGWLAALPSNTEKATAKEWIKK